jgi:hypothetical protein
METKSNIAPHINTISAAAFTALWAIGLFGALEADLIPAKMLIVSALAPLSLSLSRFFCH